MLRDGHSKKVILRKTELKFFPEDPTITIFLLLCRCGSEIKLLLERFRIEVGGILKRNQCQVRRVKNTPTTIFRRRMRLSDFPKKIGA